MRRESPPPQRWSRIDRLLPSFVAAVGVSIIVVQWAHARPLWLDEEMIALNIRDRSFTGLAGELWLDQSAPLGWLLLQRLVLITFGSSELAMRAVPALFGIATVLSALYVGQRWLTSAGSTVLVLLCSFGQWVSFHALELKPYSADTFWGLMLPALTVSVVDASSQEGRRRAMAIWLTAAALAHWFSLGALLVLPACCAVLAIWIRRDRNALPFLATAAVVIVASAAAHYMLSIRHAQANEWLQEQWQFAFPPGKAGLFGTLLWAYQQLAPFAVKPGGTAFAAPFWIAACVGFAATTHRALGLVAGLVAASGFLFAIVRVVPLYERLSMWFVPAVYLGIALCADRGVQLFREKPLPRPFLNLTTAGVLASLVLIVCANLVYRGIFDLRNGRPADSNRGTNDRQAVRWLLHQREPGVVLVTTQNSLPAIWWYGGMSIADTRAGYFPDGAPMLVLEHQKPGRRCNGRPLEKATDGLSSVQLFLGFPDTPEGFDDLVLSRLTKTGTVVALEHFGGEGRAALVNLTFAARNNPIWRGTQHDLFWRDAAKDREMLQGCVAVFQGRVW